MSLAQGHQHSASKSRTRAARTHAVPHGRARTHGRRNAARVAKRADAGMPGDTMDTLAWSTQRPLRG
eukprot:10729391-Alexandrium_andersonii.AAC.1